MKIKNNFPHICALPSLSFFRIDKMLQNNIAGMPEFPIMWGSRLTTNSNNRQLSAALRGGSEQQQQQLQKKLLIKKKNSRDYLAVSAVFYVFGGIVLRDRAGESFLEHFSLGFIVSWCNNRLFSF